MKKVLSLTIFVVIFALIHPGNASARIMMAWTDVWTTNYSDPANFQLNVWIETKDDVESHPPNYVSSIDLEDPNGTIWSFDPLLGWYDQDKGFFFSISQSSFPGGTIPSGLYKITITDDRGFSFTTRDQVLDANTPLSIPVITMPTADEVLTTATPLIRWTSTAQSKKFRVQLDEVVGYCPDDGNLYYWPIWETRDRKWTMNKFMRIPKGVLRPGGFYRIRIEGRFDFNDTDKRSRSDWVHFSIAP